MQILNLSATINVASLNPSINTYRLGEGAGTYEYPELNNKPKINGVTLVGDISSANLGIKTSDLTNDSGYISEADIPTATSDLVNDSGFVNSTQVQEVVSDAIPSDISYFNNDVGYITNADIGNIPTRTSQLENDSGYITSAEAPVVSVNNMTGAVVLDGSNIEYEQNVSLNSKIDAVEADIPTATSELENDSGFITNASIPTRTSQLVNDSGFVNAQNIPVQSVNGETGAVVLTATDIDYDSNNTVAAKIDANAQAIDSNAQSIGDISTLATSDKTSLVGAVNEVVEYREYNITNFMVNLYNQIVYTPNSTEFKIIKIGKIGIINCRFTTSSAIISGVGNIPNVPETKNDVEFRGALSSRDNKSGFIQYSGKTIVIRCDESSLVFEGQLIFVIK